MGAACCYCIRCCGHVARRIVALQRLAPRGSGTFHSLGRVSISRYMLAAPYLLARTLVAARWDASGIWILSIFGTIGLLGAVPQH